MKKILIYECDVTRNRHRSTNTHHSFHTKESNNDDVTDFSHPRFANKERHTAEKSVYFDVSLFIIVLLHSFARSLRCKNDNFCHRLRTRQQKRHRHPHSSTKKRFINNNNQADQHVFCVIHVDEIVFKCCRVEEEKCCQCSLRELR